MTTYLELEQRSIMEDHDRVFAMQLLQAACSTIQKYDDRELTGLFDFLKQDDYMSTEILGSNPSQYKSNLLKYMEDAKREEASQEVIIGAILGTWLGSSVVPSNDYAYKYGAPFHILEKNYELDPEKFNRSIASYRCITYRGIKQAQAQLTLIMQKLRTVPHHSKLKLKTVRDLFDLCGIPQVEDKDPETKRKWNIGGKFAMAGFVGVLAIGGATLIGVFPAWIIGEVIAGSWTFLMTVANQIGQRIINTSADKEAAKTPASLGYTPQNLQAMIQFVLQTKEQFVKEVKRIGFSLDGEYYDLYDENGEPMDDSEAQEAWEKRDYEYYKITKCFNTISYAIFGMARACANIVDITRK